jgi:hypothetical protein
MKRYIKTGHVVNYLRDKDEETYNDLRDLLIGAAKDVIGDETKDSVGDALVFVWFCVILIKKYAGTTQAENLRVSFVSKAIEEHHDDDGEYFVTLLPGTSKCKEWEDYCSVYGSLEELFDLMFDIDGDAIDMLMESYAEQYAADRNLEDELADIIICNFEFTSGDLLGQPILIFN